MHRRGCILAGSLLGLITLGLGGCEESGAEAAATSAPQAAPDPAPSTRGPQWGGNPALGPAKRVGENLKDDIEGRQNQLADDIERGRLPGD